MMMKLSLRKRLTVLSCSIIVPLCILVLSLIFMPVSYTHLDVYKRQEKHHPVSLVGNNYEYIQGVTEGTQALELKGSTYVDLGTDASLNPSSPVSYTHLDVYKRQVQHYFEKYGQQQNK